MDDSTRAIRADIEARFWAKVQKTETCWLWMGCLSGNGYGHFAVDGRTCSAHRVSWELIRGAIPQGMHVLHNCPGKDCRNCVNPAHLWLGSRSDNLRDAWSKGVRIMNQFDNSGERNCQAKLTQTAVDEIRRTHTGSGVPHRTIAAAHGVSRQSIGLILSGRTWKS